MGLVVHEGIVEPTVSFDSMTATTSYLTASQAYH